MAAARVRFGQCFGHRGVAPDVLQRAPGHRQQLQARCGSSACTGREPHQFQRFAQIGHGHLVGRCLHGKKARVEALGVCPAA
jgi:hypothetical protein